MLLAPIRDESGCMRRYEHTFLRPLLLVGATEFGVEVAPVAP